jgi:hypothetical protein
MSCRRAKSGLKHSDLSTKIDRLISKIFTDCQENLTKRVTTGVNAGNLWTIFLAKDEPQMRIKATCQRTGDVRFFDSDWEDAYETDTGFLEYEYLFFIDGSFYRVFWLSVGKYDSKAIYEAVDLRSAAVWLLEQGFRPSHTIFELLQQEFSRLSFGRICDFIPPEEAKGSLPDQEPCPEEPSVVEANEYKDDIQPADPITVAFQQLDLATLRTDWFVQSKNLLRMYRNRERPPQVLIKQAKNWFRRDWTRNRKSGLPWWKEFPLEKQQELLDIKVQLTEIWDGVTHRKLTDDRESQRKM